MARTDNGRRTGRSARIGRVAIALLPFLLATLGAFAREVPYGIEQTLSAGIPGALAAEVADVDRDGALDVVAAGTATGNDGIVWFRNNGLPTPRFQKRAISTSSSTSQSYGVNDLAVADVTGDGVPDIVTAAGSRPGFNTRGVVVYVTTDPIAAPWRLTPARFSGGPNTSVRLADMDGDDDLDIVSCSREVFGSVVQGTVAWYENNTTAPTFPIFNEKPISPLVDNPGGCWSVDVADVDGNGTLDVLSTAYDDDQVVWFSFDGSTWTRNEIFSGGGASSGMRALVAADFDGDGDIDVISGSEGNGRIRFHENQGDGPVPTFTTRVLVEDPDGTPEEDRIVPGIRKLRTFDPDGDGDLDVAFTAYDNSHFGWLENDGAMPTVGFTVRTLDIDPDGPFTYATNPNLFPPSPPNPDLRPDFCSPCPTVDVSFASGRLTGRVYGARGLAVGDLDGDGDIDLVTASENDDKVAWHDNRSCQGVFPFQPPVASGSPTRGAAAIAAGDLDGDGDLDVAAAASAANTVSVHLNDGMMFPSFDTDILTSSLGGVQSIRLLDFDGDGDLDILAAAPSAGRVVLFRNGGGTFESADLVTGVPGARDAAAGDVDGDGDNDLVIATSADNGVTWWKNTGSNGAPAFQPVVLSRLGKAPWAVEIADIDADGDRDIVYAALNNGRVAWLQNTNGHFQEFDIAPGSDGAGTDEIGVARAAIDIAIADVNNDDRLDVISVSAHDDKVVWYRNNGGSGTGTFTGESVISEDPDGPLSVEVALYNKATGEVEYVYSGEANGPVDGASSVFPFDVNGDGFLDLLVSSAIDNSVAWYEHNGNVDAPAFLYRGIDRDGGGARSTVLADLNGDDRPDVVAGLYKDNTVSWYLGADDDACVTFDANGDGRIDGMELVMIGRAFGLSESPQDGAEAVWWSEIDLNLDGRVDGEDLSALGAEGVWGTNVFTCRLTCPSAAD